jgi:methyl-accepting chemotaxis protein
MLQMKWISGIPIFRRLFLAAITVALIPGIIISLLGNAYINALNVRGQAVQVSTNAVHIVTTQLANLQHMNADLIALQAQTFVTTNIPGAPNTDIATLRQQLTSEIQALQTNFSQALTMYQRDYQIDTSEQMASIRDLLASSNTSSKTAADQQQTLQKITGQEWQAYSQAQASELAALQSNKPAAQTFQLLQVANNAYAPLEGNWKHIVDLAEDVGNKVVEVDTAQTNLVIIVTILAMLGIIAAVIVVGYLVHFTIVRPLRQLASLTRRIAKGDTTARASVAGRDEISLVALSMNGMLDNMVRLIQETQTQGNILQMQIEVLVNDVSGVGEGNLSVQASTTGGTLQVIGNSFNYMVAELSGLVLRVKAAAHEVTVSTAVIVDYLAQLVETGDLQLRQIARASGEVEHMAASSRQIASRAHILQTSAHEALMSVQEGRAAVQQALEGLGRIHENVQATAAKVQKLDEHSRAINSTVDVISAIVKQTNQLAYDAEVLASRGGEDARGFGAVAADIQRLAERATGQAHSIAYIVKSVRQDISAGIASMRDTERESAAGAERAREAGAALETILAAVELQAQEVEGINDMAARQLQSFTTIVQIIQRMSQATRQMNMSTRQTSQNVEGLAQQVEQLRRSVEIFKLRKGRYGASPLRR